MTWLEAQATRAELHDPFAWENATLEQYDNRLPLEAQGYWDRIGARL